MDTKPTSVNPKPAAGAAAQPPLKKKLIVLPRQGGPPRVNITGPGAVPPGLPSQPNAPKPQSLPTKP